MVISSKSRGSVPASLDVLFLICEAELLDGEHVHRAWRAQVASAKMPRSKPMIVKWLDGHLALCVELACALAAQCLDLPVPAPGIIIAPREFLPGLPVSVLGNEIMLVGSEYKTPDAFFARAATGNRAAEEFVWRKLCASVAGPAGAAWDELVANEDRHYQNALFDGSRWWLFDHDRALMSAGPFSKNPIDGNLRLELKNFRAKCNNLADQMVMRHRTSHEISAQPIEFERHRAALSLLVDAARKWTHADPRIQGIFDSTAILLEAVELRLPALALHIQARIAQPSAEDLWKLDPN
jgi:hypothetical protein